MPTKDELFGALRNADAAGATEDAVRIAQMINDGEYDDGAEISMLDPQRYLEMAKAVPRGIANTALTIGEGATELADDATNFLGYEDAIDGDTINDRFSGYREGVSDFIPVAEGYEDLFTTKVGEGLGSAATYLAPSLLTAPFSAAAGATSLLARATAFATSARGASTLGLAGLSGTGESSQLVADAKRKGIDVTARQELAAHAMGTFIGFTEVLPIFKFMKGLPNTTKNQKAAKEFFSKVADSRLGKATGTGLEEGSQEVFASLAQDFAAKVNYDPEKAVGGNLAEEFTVGGAVGFITDLALRGLGSRRARLPSDQITEEDILLEEKLRNEYAAISENAAKSATELEDYERSPKQAKDGYAGLATEVGKIWKGFGMDDVGMQVTSRLFNAVKDENGKYLYGYRTDDEGNVIRTNEGREGGEAAIPLDAEAYFDPRSRTVFMGLDNILSNPKFEGRAPTAQEFRTEVAGILSHEIIHPMRELDLFTQKEWMSLEEVVKRDTVRDESGQAAIVDGKPLTYVEQALMRYPTSQGYTPVEQMEEAIAERSRAAVNGNHPIAGKPRSLMNRFVEFFQRLFKTQKALGLNSAAEVMDAIQNGTIAARQRGEVRSKLMTERGQQTVVGRGITERDMARPQVTETGQAVPDFYDETVQDEQVQPEFPAGTPVNNASATLMASKRDDYTPTMQVSEDPQRQAVWEIGDRQRGAPEAAMLRAKDALGSGVLSYAVEHVGDITHRMTEENRWAHTKDYPNFGYEDVRFKVRHNLDSLRSGYGFERDHNENMRDNALANGENLSEKEGLVSQRLSEYAQEHRKIPVYNDAQRHARDAAVALGDQDFAAAEGHLSALSDMLETREKWVKEAGKFDPNYENKNAPLLSRRAQADELGFYRQAEQAVLDMKFPQWKKSDGVVNGKDIYNKLKASEGVKADELKWSTYEEIFTNTNAKFTQDEAVEIVRQGGITLREVVADSTGGVQEQDTTDRVMDEAESAQYWKDSLDVFEFYIDGDMNNNLTAREQALFLRYKMAASSPPNSLEGTVVETTKTHVLPNGDVYTSKHIGNPATGFRAFLSKPNSTDIGLENEVGDILDTHPSYGESEVALAEAFRSVRDENTSTSGEAFVAQYDSVSLNTPGEFRNYREFKTILPQDQRMMEKAGVFQYPDHFGDDNILFFLRVNDRDIEGKSTLMLDEVQSDWHSEGRKNTYRDSNYPTEGEVIKLSNSAHKALRTASDAIVDKLVDSGAMILSENQFAVRGLSNGILIKDLTNYTAGTSRSAERAAKLHMRHTLKEMVDTGLHPGLRKYRDSRIPMYDYLVGEGTDRQKATYSDEMILAEVLLDLDGTRPEFWDNFLVASAEASRIQRLGDAPPDAPLRYKDAWLSAAMKRATVISVKEGKQSIAWPHSSVLKERWSDAFDYAPQYDQKMPSLAKKILKSEPRLVEVPRTVLARQPGGGVKAKETSTKIWVVDIPTTVQEQGENYSQPLFSRREDVRVRNKQWNRALGEIETRGYASVDGPAHLEAINVIKKITITQNDIAHLYGHFNPKTAKKGDWISLDVLRKLPILLELSGDVYQRGASAGESNGNITVVINPELVKSSKGNTIVVAFSDGALKTITPQSPSQIKKLGSSDNKRLWNSFKKEAVARAIPVSEWRRKHKSRMYSRRMNIEALQEQNFNTSQIMYHGTAVTDLHERGLKGELGSAVHVAYEPNFASTFAEDRQAFAIHFPETRKVEGAENNRAVLYPIYVRDLEYFDYRKKAHQNRMMIANPEILPAMFEGTLDYANLESIVGDIKNAGFPGYIDFEEPNGKPTGIAVFDADNVRSVFSDGSPPRKGLLFQKRGSVEEIYIPKPEDAYPTLPIGDVERSVAEVIANAKGNPSSEELAEAMGAPKPRMLDGEVDPRDVDVKPTSMAELRRMAKQGMAESDNLDWYLEFGEGLTDIVGIANMHEASVVFGVTSAQSDPEQNTANTLHIMMMARKYNPAKNPEAFKEALKTETRADGKKPMITPNQIDRITRLYETGYSESGLKTSTYMQVVQDRGANRFNPFSVMDVHMARIYGYKRKKMGRKGDLIDDSIIPSEYAYRYSQYLTSVLAQEMDISPDKMQAALWFYARQHMSNKVSGTEGTWASAKNYAYPEIAAIQEMVDNGTFDPSTPPTPALKKELRPSNKSITKRNRFSNTNFDEQLLDLGRARSPVAVGSAVPGYGGGYGFPKAQFSLNDASQYNSEVLSAILDSRGQVPFLTELGYPHEVRTSYGTFGEIEPNIIINLLGVGHREAEGAAAILGHALLQDSVLANKPNLSGGDQAGLVVTKRDGTDFTLEEIKAVNKAVNPLGKTDDGINFTAANLAELTFIDPASYENNYDTKKQFTAFAQSLLSSLPIDIPTDIRSYRQDGTYIKSGSYGSYSQNAWDRASASRSSSIQQRLQHQLYDPVWEVYKRWADSYQFSPPARPKPDKLFSRRSGPEQLAVRSSRLQSGRDTAGIVLRSQQTTAISVAGVHYGKERVPVLLGDRSGTGIRGAERKRLSYPDVDPRIKNRVYFYSEMPDTGRLPPPEAGVGRFVYSQKFNNILGNRTEAFKEIARRIDTQYNRGTDPWFSAFESAVIDAGYDGYTNAGAGMVVLLDANVPVNYLGVKYELAQAGYTPADMLDLVPESRDTAPSVAPASTQELEQASAEIEENILSTKAGNIPRYSSVASPEANFVARNPDRGAKLTPKQKLAFTRRGMPDDTDPELARAVRGIINVAPVNKTRYETYEEATGESKLDYWLTKARQEAVFRYARLEELTERNPDIQHLADSSSIAAAVMIDASRGVLASTIKTGVPVYQNGHTKVIDFIDPITGNRLRGLIDVMAPLMGGEYGDITELAQAYAISRRTDRLTEEGKKVPVTQEYKDIINERISRYTDENGRNIIEDWHTRWQAFNGYTIQFMRDTGILNDETAQSWIDYGDYYPFYRVAEGLEGGVAKGENKVQEVFSSLTGTTHIRELKGSEAPINMEMIEAITFNLTAAIDMGMKNVAQQRIIRDMTQLGLAQDANTYTGNAPVVKFKVNGKDREFVVFDPLIFESMQALQGDSLMHFVNNTFGKASALLRETITRDPGFMMVNLLRDTLSTFVTSGANFVPVLDTLKGLTEETERLERTGVAGGYDQSNDPDDIKKFWDKELRRRGKGGGSVNMFTRMWDTLGHYTTLSDAATRNAVYDDVLARTGNEAEASYQAKEIINFSRRGRSVAMRVLTTAIPFLNARIQGLDVFQRALTGRYSTNAELDRGQIIRSALIRSAALTSLTGLYWLLVSDDDQYKEASPEVRDNNWLLPTPWGVPLKLPIPFEVGLLAKTIPETVINVSFGDRTAREGAETVKRGVISTLEINPLGVQLFGPLLEAAFNHNSFTGRPIVPHYFDQKIVDGVAGRSNTNELASMIGEALNINPMKVEHVMEGYTGTLGSYVWDVVDIGLRKASGDPKKQLPSMPMYRQFPVIKRFFAAPHGAGYKQQFYDLSNEVNKTIGTMDMLKRNGRIDELKSFMHGREDLLAVSKATARMAEKLAKLRRYKEMITTSELTPDEKAKRVDEIDALTNAMLEQPVARLREVTSLPVKLPFLDSVYR